MRRTAPIIIDCQYSTGTHHHCLSDLLNFLIKCTLSLTVCIHCSPSEVNLNICAVGSMTLLYPHAQKIFTRDLSSCVVCLTLCNNFILLYCLSVLSQYTIILGLQVLFLFLFACLFLCHVLSHMRLLLTYLLTYKPYKYHSMLVFECLSTIVLRTWRRP